MSFKKRPLKQTGAPAYPDAKSASTNRREFLAAVGKLSAAGAALLIAGCDHVTDLTREATPEAGPGNPLENDTGDWAGDIGPTDTGTYVPPRDTGEGYLGGDPGPDTATSSDTMDDRWIDTGYLDGDIAPPPLDTDTGYIAGDTDVPPMDTDTGYITGDTDVPPMDTDTKGVDTEEVPSDTELPLDTGAWMGIIQK